MPRLRPLPGQGRKAAALTQESVDETVLEGAEDQKPEIQEETVDPTEALKTQIEALKRSNQEYLEKIEQERQQKAEALKRAQERELEFGKLQEQTVNSQQEAINAAIVAAQSEAESAQRDIEQAYSIGDAKATAEAHRKLARAEARLQSLETGKEALEREIKERPKIEPKAAEPDPLENFNIPPLAKSWLRQHPDYLTDPRKNAKLQALHWDVVDEGYTPYSAEYFDVMEQKLKMRAAPIVAAPVEEDEDVDGPPESPRKAIVAAPPSREAPSMGSSTPRGGQITLTKAQKEAAKIAGIEEKEYAMQLIKLQKAKSEGFYGGGQ